jgi:hypothetical protein
VTATDWWTWTIILVSTIASFLTARGWRWFRPQQPAQLSGEDWRAYAARQREAGASWEEIAEDRPDRLETRTKQKVWEQLAQDWDNEYSRALRDAGAELEPECYHNWIDASTYTSIVWVCARCGAEERRTRTTVDPLT